MKSIIQIALFTLTAILAGCGVYSFSPGGKSLFESVNISQFENKTIEYQLADRLTDAVVDAFIKDNTIKVREASKADAILTGTLSGYRRDPYTYDKEDVVTEYVVKVSISVKVVKANSEDVIWEEEFFAQGVYDAIDETEEVGQDRAVTLLTSDIMDRTTKSW
jgi:outer membrane lipopolysaccharide assembly protein LptE/RlpB